MSEIYFLLKIQASRSLFPNTNILSLFSVLVEDTNNSRALEHEPTWHVSHRHI